MRACRKREFFPHSYWEFLLVTVKNGKKISGFFFWMFNRKFICGWGAFVCFCKIKNLAMNWLIIVVLSIHCILSAPHKWSQIILQAFFILLLLMSSSLYIAGSFWRFAIVTIWVKTSSLTTNFLLCVSI